MGSSAAQRKNTPQHAGQKQSDSRLEIITPPRLLKDRVKIRPAKPGVTDPIKNADNSLMLLQNEFPFWLEEEAQNLQAAWQSLEDKPGSAEAFKKFHKAIHSVRGNAEMLGCIAASNLANPLAKLLERKPKIDQHLSFLKLGTSSILVAISENLPADDPRVTATTQSMMEFVDRWLSCKQAD